MANKYISYALSFVSFVLPKLPLVEEIILFGSAAREEADEDSDIDIFFSIKNKKQEKAIKDILEKEKDRFQTSKIAKLWHLKGIKNSISIYTGDINEWELKKSIISEGITLYGPYKESSKKEKHLVLFILDIIKSIAKRNKTIRTLFGRKENKQKKDGLINKYLGKQLTPRTFLIPSQHASIIRKYLNDEKISHRLIEFWTNSFP